MYTYFNNPPPPFQNIAIHFYLSRETNGHVMIYRVYILLHSCISYDDDRALGHFLIATQLVFKVILIALNKGEYTFLKIPNLD